MTVLFCSSLNHPRDWMFFTRLVLQRSLVWSCIRKQYQYDTPQLVEWQGRQTVSSTEMKWSSRDTSNDDLESKHSNDDLENCRTTGKKGGRRDWKYGRHWLLLEGKSVTYAHNRQTYRRRLRRIHTCFKLTAWVSDDLGCLLFSSSFVLCCVLLPSFPPSFLLSQKIRITPHYSWTSIIIKGERDWAFAPYLSTLLLREGSRLRI